MGLRINKIHHVAIISADYARSKQFYVDILGCTVVREIYRAERQSYKLDLELGGVYCIELFSFPDPPQRVSRPEASGTWPLKSIASKRLHTTCKSTTYV